MNPSLRLLFSLSVFVSVFFIFFHASDTPRYESFSTIQPEADSVCGYQNSKEQHLAGSAHYETLGDSSCSFLVRAQSDVLELHYKTNPLFKQGTQELFVELENGEVLNHQQLHVSSDDPWFRLRANVTKGDFVRVRAINAQSTGQLLLRKRVNHLALAYFSNNIYMQFFSAILLSLQIAICLFYSLSFFGTERKAILHYFVLYIPLLFTCFYRLDLTFYFDDWTIQEKILDLDFAFIAVRHNEHWPIVANFITYIESVLFGNYYSLYILASIFIHMLNGLLVVVICRQLLKDIVGAKSLSIVLGVVFLFSALHVENLQWDVCKQMLLTIFFILASLSASLAYLQNKNAQTLLLLFLLSILSCFSMATGFLVLGIVPAICLVFASCISDEKEHLVILRSVLVSFFVLVACVISAWFYFSDKTAIAGGVMSSLAKASPKQFVGFIVFGSQYGSLLRGVFGFLPDVYDHRIEYISVGVLINFLVLILGRFLMPHVTKKKRLGYWLIGQVFILLPMLLFAIGRSYLGANASLVPRYHSLTYVGVLFILLPVFDAMVRGVVANVRGLEAKEFVSNRAVVFIVFTSFFFIQIQSVDRFDRLVVSGQNSGNFNLKMREWNRLLQREPYQLGPWFEGIGSGYEGMYPYSFERDKNGLFLSKPPIVHPDIVQKILE